MAFLRVTSALDSHLFPNVSAQDVGLKDPLLHFSPSPLSQVQRNLYLFGGWKGIFPLHYF